MKKVFGAFVVVLLSLSLFCAPVWASKKKHDKLKKHVDQNVLVCWWVWNLAYYSGDKTKLYSAAAIFEQAMRISAAFEGASVNGDISDNDYSNIFAIATNNSYAVNYFYQGDSRTYSYFSSAQTAINFLPTPAATNVMYRTLLAVQTFIYYGTVTTEPTPQPLSGV